jgi:arylsulfatase A-like enzyme
MLTGLRPDAIKVWDLVTHFREAVPDVVTLPEYFKQNGYYTVGVGKIFHGSLLDSQSWSVPKPLPSGISLYADSTMQRLEMRNQELLAEGKTNQEIWGKYRGPGVQIRDEPDNQMVDGAIADIAVDIINKTDSSFFLAVGFVRPHLPFVAPKKYFDLYDPNEIPQATNPFLPKGSPRYAMDDMYELRAYEEFADTPTPFKGLLSEEEAERLKHGYYACTSFVDAQVGKLLAALEKKGIAKNTIVVLWGDHGWKLGEHGSWTKQTNYEIDTRVPLIINTPWSKKDVQSNALVELVDVYPTLCELSGLPIPESLEGTSLVPLLNEPDLKWKTAVFSQFKRKRSGITYMGRSIRTDRYRYVQWENFDSKVVMSRELFDHKVDMEENVNIADDQINSGLLKDLESQLKRGWKGALPTEN